MAGRLQALSRNAASQICSGQVITQLHIAVKELVENALVRRAQFEFRAAGLRPGSARNRRSVATKSGCNGCACCLLAAMGAAGRGGDCNRGAHQGPRPRVPRGGGQW